MVSILILIILSPLLVDFSDLSLILNFFFSYILLTCIFAISRKKIQLITGLILAVPYSLSMWTTLQHQHIFFLVTGLLLGICYFFYIVIILLVNILDQPRVSLETIFGAVSAYLLIGVAWSLVFSLIENLHPGSFSFPDHILSEPRYSFLYFSFITLTTLGYGDITPITSVAKSWCILEATIGQIYMVVLVAGLVGHFISQKIQEKTQE